MSDGYGTLEEFNREAAADPINARNLVRSGHFGSVFGTDLIVSRIITPGTVYTLAEPEYVGVMPTRQDVDFRVVGDDNFSALFLDAGISHIGIGSASPDVDISMSAVVNEDELAIMEECEEDFEWPSDHQQFERGTNE